MQISDEMFDRADMAFRLSSADRKGALRAALEYALSALSLPVQPVAWRWPVEGGFIYCENKDEVLVEDGSEQPLYANPVPPTKGPEDDLIAARAAAHAAELLGLGRWRLGTRVTKIKGSSWTGHVVGYYRTKLTPVGYCVESETETGSVQLYPAAALRASPLGEQ